MPTDSEAPAAPSASARRINLLPAELVNQIAAGEVIERPASVVKELVENALDAGATRLTVDLEKGGASLIRVVDDGRGIPAEDLPLAIQNHATSKLSCLEDLFAIASLGFRGEALASIGSVSQFRLASRPPDAEAGAEITVDGGVVGPIKAAALPKGTRVEVRNLFFNVPARRKFLKSERSEISAVTHQLTRLALSRADVFITLRHNGKAVLSVPPADDPRERIARLTTQVIAEEAVAVGPVEGKKVPMRLRGYVSPFNVTRADTRGQYFFLNGRAIRDPLLLGTIKDAYLHLLPPRRHPYVFLWLDVEPEDVDVNVHPTKSEVRFRHASDVYALMVSSIKSALSELAEPPPLLPERRPPQPAPGGGPAPIPRVRGLATPERTRELGFPQLEGPKVERLGMKPLASAGAPTLPAEPRAHSPVPSHSAPHSPPASCPSHGPEAPAHPPPERLAEGGLPPDEASPIPARPRVRAGRFIQMHNSFILEETAEGLKIIDQHALHERILYDQIVSRLSEGALETQRMLFPLMTQVDAEQAVLFAEVQPILLELGFDLELRDRELRIKSIPSFVKATRAERIVVDLLAEKHPSFIDDEVLALERSELKSKAFQTQEGRTLLHTFAASLACKAAVKFGMPLTHDEIAALLARRHEVERAYCCPHGRPTTLSLGMGELRRRFGRPG